MGAFAARVEGCKEMKGRKKGGFYLRRNAKEVEERFRNRNLGDTRYATRLLLDLLARMYPEDGKRHVLARPGQLTAKLRRAWGLDDLKKDVNGKRQEDDRHHALDAIVLAATSESMLQRLTKAAQEAERQGAPRGFDFTHVPLSRGQGSARSRARQSMACLSPGPNGGARVARRMRQRSSRCDRSRASRWCSSGRQWRN